LDSKISLAFATLTLSFNQSFISNILLIFSRRVDKIILLTTVISMVHGEKLQNNSEKLLEGTSNNLKTKISVANSTQLFQDGIIPFPTHLHNKMLTKCLSNYWIGLSKI
jgi:hypothetical protein